MCHRSSALIGLALVLGILTIAKADEKYFIRDPDTGSILILTIKPDGTFKKRKPIYHDWKGIRNGTITEYKDPSSAPAVSEKPSEPAQPATTQSTEATISQEANGDWLISPCHVDVNGQGVRNASEYPPESYILRPVMLEQEYRISNADSFTHLFPLIRAVGECCPHLFAVRVSSDGGSTRGVTVVSTSPNQNQFAQIEMRGKLKTLHVQLVAWVTQPSSAGTDPTGGTKSDLLAMVAAAKQRTENDISYDATVNTVNLEVVTNGRRGDCGAMATYMRALTQDHVEVIAGWDVDAIDSYGGCHAWARSRKGGWVGDAAMHYLGREDDTQLPALVGTEFRLGTRQLTPGSVPNGGACFFAPKTKMQFSRVQLSTPDKGPSRAVLSSLTQIPEDVQKSHDQFVQERREINTRTE